MNTVPAEGVARERLLLLEWDGATLDRLVPMAESGILPGLAQLLGSGAHWRLRWCGLGSPTSAWTTLRSGCGPERHGTWDESRLDHRRRRVVTVDEAQAPCPALPELLLARDRRACLRITDQQEAAGIWGQKPGSLGEIAEGVRQTEGLLTGLVDRACRAVSVDWQLLEVRFQVLAFLEHRLWNLTEFEPAGAKRQWIEAALQAWRALDRALQRFLVLADRCQASVAIVSPYGFVPFREKITVPELLRQHGLLEMVAGLSKANYWSQRFVWRRVRRLARGSHPELRQGVDGPVGALLPINWRRSRAVTLHGQHAALVYLNVPERFGTRVLTTTASRDAALGETMTALGGARHPVTGEKLFADVYSTAARHGVDPLEHGWPDVVAVPCPGFLTRHKPDHRRHLLRPDPSLAAVQGSDGMLLLHAPGVQPSQQGTLGVSEVAKMLLRLQGRPSVASQPAGLG